MIKNIIWFVSILWLAESALVRADSASQWVETIERVADSVVSLEIASDRPFDSFSQGISTATGFVVDAKKGIILTNRHVVGSGPIKARATFQNQERLDLVPLYRDPVHDFGFLQYDPRQLEYIQPKALSLRPEKARRGLNIRVLGSDGGEQLSILAGTIARVDRPAPRYNRYSYNDYNTFYLQAASSTSGGSSGSPVIDIQGDVVALNAAGNNGTASSFYLPLDRVVYALEHLQKNRPIARGTLKTLFNFQPFHTLRRIGLTAREESNLRQAQPKTRGMLVVGQVIVGGVAAKQLLEGDILIGIDGKRIVNFVELEAFLDNHVGKTVRVSVQRQGVNQLFDIRVADLNALQPMALVEVGGAVLYDVTPQMARATNKPQQGVYLADRGYMFSRSNMPNGAIISSINNRPINNLVDFISLLENSADGDEWIVRYYVLRHEFTSYLARVIVDRHWFNARYCWRKDQTPDWPCELIASVKKPIRPLIHTITQLPQYRDALIKKLAPALVGIHFDIPHSIDNVYAQHFAGTGLIVDAQRGLVVADRNTVPTTLGDARLIFFESYEIPARVVFLHPVHNIALLEYDPSAIEGVDVQVPTLVDGDLLDPNPRLSMIGFDLDGSLINRAVNSVGTQTLNFNLPQLPRFQQEPVDVFTLQGIPPTMGGIVSDQEGHVYAFWSSFAYPGNSDTDQGEWAIPSDIVQEALMLYRTQKPLRVLGASLGYIPLAGARQLGLTNQWIKQIASEREEAAVGRRVLTVQQVTNANSKAHKSPFMVGDLLLAIDRQPVVSLRDVEKSIQKPRVEVTLLRNGTLQMIDLSAPLADVRGTRRILHWSGAYLQQPHREVSAQRGLPAEGLYVSGTFRGSPARLDGLYQNHLITEVDGQSVKTIDHFISLVADKKAGQYTRLTLVNLKGDRRLVSVRPAYRFWPTFELINDGANGQGWHRIDY